MACAAVLRLVKVFSFGFSLIQLKFALTFTIWNLSLLRIDSQATDWIMARVAVREISKEI